MNTSSLAERAATLHDVLAELSDRDGNVHISLRQLATTLNYSYGTVHNALTYLEDVNLIRWIRPRGQAGSVITVLGR